MSLNFVSPVLGDPGIIGPSPEDTLTAIEEAVATNKKDAATRKSLEKALTDDSGDVRVRERAAWALGKLGVTSAAPSLIEAAHHKSLLIRSAALNSLVQLRASSAVPIFIDSAQNDPILSIRQRSTVALGLLKADKAIPTLANLSADPREEIRGAAALALGGVHSAKNDATQILNEMKKDSSAYVQERAKRALEGIHGTMAQLQQQLESPDPDVRLFAALHYARRGRNSDLKRLGEAANGDADEDVRQELQAAIKAIKSRTSKAGAAKPAKKAHRSKRPAGGHKAR